MIVEITCRPDEITDQVILEKKIRRVSKGYVFDEAVLVRRWIDARGKKPKFRLRYNLQHRSDKAAGYILPSYQHVEDRPVVNIIGAGPAGYFAALECLSLGIKPVIWEQGKDVRARRRDLRAIQQDGVVHPRSNYCFGEGGAGTYSDGKLYTRAKKRGDVQYVLERLVEHGANPAILVDAHPHIGSNKLPGVITRIRETIERFGGQVHFEQEVIDLGVSNAQINHLEFSNGRKINAERVILATGHSARSIYHLFHKNNWALEAKPFALGVRIEHPQALIDLIQYGQQPRHTNLPAAEYRLACEIDGRGVFSFCMCPGGLIIPAATAAGEIVVNGMSLSRRDSPFANSGFVVAVRPEDLSDNPDQDPMVCLRFQQALERKMFEQGDGGQAAPAQRLVDFVAGRASNNLPKSSYIPGIFPARLDLLLPAFLVNRMRKGLLEFNDKLKKYIHDDAILVGIESRTSAPVKIPRNSDTLEHPDIGGLYPCGEGAGYAGGIMSAALDGRRVVRAISHHIDVPPSI